MAQYDNPTAEALDLWQQIVGITPETRSFSMGNFHHRIEFDDLKEALDLDPTEITANLMLGAFARARFRATTITMQELLDDPASALAQMEKPRRLLEILERPEIAERREAFLSGVRQALEFYDAGDRDDIRTLLANHDQMAFLRRDALRSMANLSVHQFLDGDPEPDGVKPVYYRFVHQWFNINSMLDFAASQAPGVSLNLVRDPNDYQSYFCFAIRNGGRLFVLSDVPQDAHPMAPMLSRRPDRDMDRRIARNWFPYDLMGLAYNQEDGRLYFDRSEERALVVGQSKALPLKPISKLGAPETVWTAMMFGLIVERFWRRGHTEKGLSYTGEMIRVTDRMIKAAGKAGLPVKGYTPIDMRPLSVEDVREPDASALAAYGSADGSHHRWLEERYAHLVSEDSLNVIASPERHHTLALASGNIEDSRKPYEKPHRFYGESRQVPVVPVQKLASTSFGTKEKLEADRLFVARYNYAVQIDALARNEYEKRRAEVADWYRGRLEGNLGNLKKWVGDHVLWMEDPYPSSRNAGKRYHPREGEKERNLRTLAYPWELDNEYDRMLYLGSNYLGGWKNGVPLCAATGNRATYAFAICPANAAEVAIVAGCSVDDLPDVLRHFSLAEYPAGNHILTRVDPVAWAIHDPWNDLDLRACILLSKRGFARLAAETDPPAYWRENGCDPAYRQEWRRTEE